MRKLRRLTKSTIVAVKQLCDGLNLRLDNAEVEIGTGSAKGFRLGNRLGQRVGCTLEVGALIAIRIRDRHQKAPKAGASALIVGWEIRAAVKRLTVRQEKPCQRPATLSRQSADS